MYLFLLTYLVNANYITQANLRVNSGSLIRNPVLQAKPTSILSEASRCRSNPKEYLGSNKNLGGYSKEGASPYVPNPFDGRSKSALRNAKHTLNAIGVTTLVYS